MSDFFSLFSTSSEKAEKRAKIEAKKAAKRRSTLKDLDTRSYRAHTSKQLDPEEIRKIYRLGEYKRAEVEMPGIRQRLRQKRYQLLKPQIRRSRRKSRKRNTSFKTMRGEENEIHDYLGNSEDDYDMRPTNDEGHLIQPPPPPPTVQMRINDLNNKNYIRGGKTRKRRRKRRRKTKRKGRRKTKKRRKRRKRKTRRKR